MSEKRLVLENAATYIYLHSMRVAHSVGLWAPGRVFSILKKNCAELVTRACRI